MGRPDFFREPIVLLIACAMVGLLATRGVFESMMGFPGVFGGVCLVLGLLSLRQQPRVSLAPRLAVILLGPALAVAGFFVQGHNVKQRRCPDQRRVARSGQLE